MNAEMETTIVILWLAGVVCGVAFFTGLASLIWNVWKKYFERLPFAIMALAIGFAGMMNSIFTILRLVRSWMAG